MSTAAGQDYNLGSVGRNSVGQTLVPGVGDPSPPASPTQIPSGPALKTALQFPWYETRMAAPEATHNAGGAGCCRHSFPTEGTRGSRIPLPVVLRPPGGGVVRQCEAGLLTLFVRSVCLGLHGAWVLQPHPHVLGVSQWCLARE